MEQNQPCSDMNREPVACREAWEEMIYIKQAD